MFLEEHVNTIVNADCREVFKKLPDGCIDCFFSDIPYKICNGGMSLSSMFGTKKKLLHDKEKLELYKQGKIFKYNDIDPDEYLPEVYRVMKESAHGYIMVNAGNLVSVGTKIENAGFIINNILVMRKNNAVTNIWYMKDCEFTIFFRKGRAKPLNNHSIKSCIDVMMPRERIHDTQKPVDYIAKLISNSTQEGDIVLDPFSGSGSTAIACKQTNRKFLCVEIDPEYYKKSVKRLNDSYAQGCLF